jgi:DNA-binding response OmpR family regulator
MFVAVVTDSGTQSDIAPDSAGNGHVFQETDILRGSETILLAEDDRILMDVTADLLEFHGYKVIRAHDGAEAVELFKEFQDTIDLVIMDAVMPKLTGKQAWDRICSVNPDVKGCFFSGYVNEIIGGKLVVDYSLPFIGKPFSSATFLQTVRTILDGAYPKRFAGSQK